MDDRGRTCGNLRTSAVPPPKTHPPRSTWELMTQTAECGLCGCRIDPCRCHRTSSEIHAAGEREVCVFKGFRCRPSNLTARDLTINLGLPLYIAEVDACGRKATEEGRRPARPAGGGHDHFSNGRYFGIPQTFVAANGRMSVQMRRRSWAIKLSSGDCRPDPVVGLCFVPSV